MRSLRTSEAVGRIAGESAVAGNESDTFARLGFRLGKNAMRLSSLLCVMLLTSGLQAGLQTAAGLQASGTQALDPDAGQIFALANQTRTAQGLGSLTWDPALAAAALQHCKRMSVEGAIAHRYGGELDLTERAGHAGAHFSLIEENIAVGASAARIHQAWMESPDHRANLLNPEIDRVGIAVVAANGVLFAVADYGRGVQSMDTTQVEAHFAAMLRTKGLGIVKDPSQARAYCSSSGRFSGADQPSFLMRWQNPDTDQLPEELLKQVATKNYQRAAVGSCPAQGVDGGFTIYRVAVLLY